MADETQQARAARSETVNLAMALATDGDLLRDEVTRAAERLGPLREDWTRFVRLAVIDVPPEQTG